jgi:hypothetical protein
MAKKSAAKPKQKKPIKRVNPRRRRSGDSNGLGIFFIIGLVILAFFKTDVAMLIALGLIPTIVLGFTGKGTHKTQRMMTVGLANLAGIIMLVADVWSGAVNFDQIITGADSWIIMWGSAAIGYALNYVGPMIAAIVMQGLAQDRIKNINQQKQELVELWGHEVLGNNDEKPDLGFIKPRRSSR